MNYSVLVVIDVPEMYWVMSAGLIPPWTLRPRFREIKVVVCEDLHRDSGVMTTTCLWKKSHPISALAVVNTDCILS